MIDPRIPIRLGEEIDQLRHEFAVERANFAVERAALQAKLDEQHNEMNATHLKMDKLWDEVSRYRCYMATFASKGCERNHANTGKSCSEVDLPQQHWCICRPRHALRDSRSTSLTWV